MVHESLSSEFAGDVAEAAEAGLREIADHAKDKANAKTAAELLLAAVVECAPVGTPEDLIDALTTQIAKDDAAARARIAEAFHPGRHVRQAAR